MRLILFLTLDGAEYYGYIPFFRNDKNNSLRTERYELNWEDSDLLDSDFINPVNKLTNSLIDIGDVEYLDADKCKIMISWLTHRLTEPLDPKLRETYRVLVTFARKAIALNTGILFDL